LHSPCSPLAALQQSATPHGICGPAGLPRGRIGTPARMTVRLATLWSTPSADAIDRSVSPAA
jgi:hypothetical protein